MARKIQIDIEVNGKMQKATVSAKKLRNALGGIDENMDNISKSSRTADRNIKGTAQASSSASKNFSKMQQGMGGLVGAYASLAASLFAVSAAFNFLKSAGELKSLQAGQVAYASATGTALKTLTNDIIEATNNQIAFKDAAQAAAIGTAAGLTTNQMERLGKAAADASQVLGRDVTDSFNRLVRGVTKAEPELLDELGIILRLEDATTDYGLALGKAGKDLNTFERQQAVANFVLTESEKKYSDILDIVGRSPNQYAQLGKAFDDIIMSVKGVVDMVAGPLAKVLQDTPALAIASLGVLLSGPLKALGFSFKGIADAAQDAAAKQRTFYRGVRDDANLARKTTKEFKRDLQGLGAAGLSSGAKSGILKSFAAGRDLSGAEAARFQSQVALAEKNVNRLGIVTKGEFTGMKIHMVREMDEAFMNMNLEMDKTLTKSQVFALRAKAAFAGIGAAVKTIAAGIAASFSRLLSVISYAAIAFTGYQMYQEFNKAPLTDQEKALEKQAQAAEKFRERLAGLNDEFEKFADVQKRLAKDDGAKVFGNLANFLGALGEGGTAAMLTGIGVGKGVNMDANAAEKEFSKTAVYAGTGLGLALFGNAFRKGGARVLGPTMGKLAVKAATGIAARAGFTAAGAAMGTAMLPGLGTAIGAGLGLLAGGVASYFASKTILPEKIDNARRAGMIPDEVSGGDSQERLNKITLSDDGIARLEQISATIKGMRDETGVTTVAFDSLLVQVEELLNSEGPITQEQIDRMVKTENDAIKLSNSFAAIDKNQLDAAKSLKAYIAEAAKLSKEETMIDQLILSRDGLNTQIAQFYSTGGDKGNKAVTDMVANRDRLNAQIGFLETIADIERDKRNFSLDTQENIIRLVGDESAEKKIQIQYHNDMLALAEQRRNIEADITALKAKEALAAENPNFEGSREQKGILEAGEELERQEGINRRQMEDRAKQFAVQNATNAEQSKQKEKELGYLKQIVDEAKKQVQLRQKLLDLEKASDDRQMDRIETEERLRNPFYYIDQENRRAKMELASFNKRYDREKQLILDRGKVAKQAINAEYALLQHRLSVAKTEGQAKNTISSGEVSAIGALQQELNNTQQLAQQAAAASQEDELEQLEHKKFMLESQIQLTSRLQEAVEESAISMEENFTNAFAAIISGSESGKEAFKQLANSMLQDISRIIARLLVQQMIMSAMNMLGNIFGVPATGAVPTNISTLPASGKANFTPGAFDFRYGGVVKKGYEVGGVARGSDAGYMTMLHGTEAVVPLPNGRSIPVEMSSKGEAVVPLPNGRSIPVEMSSKGEQIKGYEVGGVARGPDAGYMTMLHGTEAVVPLPNGRSIPVEMSGGGAQTNNVSVNVNVNNDGSAETKTEGDSKEMGRAIAAAVQRELQSQKRPGGLLSPYGSR